MKEPITLSGVDYYPDGRKLTTTDNVTFYTFGKNTTKFWWLPNTYDDICEYGGAMCGFATKEKAIKYYQKKGYTFTDL
tara:strand:+ start:953 stop:1186 length:234 start_codon:yes stop_codon:yes gene_type:complete